MEKQTSIPTISNDLHSAFESYMSSEIFELVADNGVRFFVHKDILAHQSRPFKDATSGVWKESTERKIYLQDWDARTVGRLVQFLYTGDYKYSDSSLPGLKHSLVEEQSLPKLPDEHEPRQSRTLAPFLECIVGAMPERPNPSMTDDTWLEHVNILNFDFEEIFLAHAKVYTLAHYKSIAALKALAQERLSRILLKLHPLGPNTKLAMNISTLATYVYGNTDCLASSEEPLRNIISHFVALNFASWQKDSAAVEMMCSSGDFVKDLLAKLSRRLGGQIEQGLAPPGTRFIVQIRVVRQDAPPPEHVPELDSSTGQVKDVKQAQGIWLVPEYTTAADTAATHFFISQTAGLTISSIAGRECGSACRVRSVVSKDARTRITEVALVRCPGTFLELGKFQEYDGIISHTGHSANNEDNLHILWKSVKTSLV